VARREHRLTLDDGRVIVAEGSGDSWFVYMEDDPDNCSGGMLDGLVVAELLGYTHNDDYPEIYDQWVEQIKAAR